MKNSSAYFLGNKDNDSLQRLYGISFPDPKQMTEYKHFLEEAAKRDHRRIGKVSSWSVPTVARSYCSIFTDPSRNSDVEQDQELFFFHELSPGSCFWLPHGTRIYNTLMDLMKSEYRKRGYGEVISPNMYNSELWKVSGHWQKYVSEMNLLQK